MKTAVVRARIPETLKKDFEAAAAAHGWNLSHAIRQLMNQYVEQEKELERRHQQTLEAIEDVEAGRVVDGKKVLDWLAGWGDDDEQEPPL
jgi:antitoxin component of RelBE/YafQ-DinJ toxin-antitoxin module